MKNIVKTVSLLTIISVIPGAWAATSRVSVTGQVSPRLPSIAGYINSTNTNAIYRTSTTTSSTAVYYGNSECIEKYTDCIQAEDVCGSDFQECTTNVLFHGQMSKCTKILYQCTSSGVNALFGTTAINALSDIAESHYVPTGKTNANGAYINEQVVDRYTYPTDGSVLGQLIIGASVTNRLNTEQCIKRYTNCLHRDDVCGSDFELCTTKKELKKQALLCDSTLQRCQEEGKTQLFGSVSNAYSLDYTTDSRIGTMVADGAALAASNAVRTCQKVTDNCLVSACTKNPFRCVEGIKIGTIGAADFVSGETSVGYTSDTQSLGSADYVSNYLETQTGSEIRKMLKAQCLETIGANKYCHMTYREKSPSNKDLVDIDLQEDVFSLAYAARKDAVNTKVQEMVKKFDKNAKDACLDTIKSCAMRSCGGGLGSVCYKLARTTMKNGCVNNTTGESFLVNNIVSATSKAVTSSPVHVNGDATYNDIYSGCEAIVNADANCQYAATSDYLDDGYNYAYTTDDVTTFNVLFPRCNAGNDKIGAIGTLNSILATSYNDAAIENMKKQCQTVALSCVKSMCGKDYVNCYRHRTDIVSGSYETDQNSFNNSMNKVGGVLDYNIVMGLCVNTVKNSPVCEEHLKIATSQYRYKSDTNSWGTTWDANGNAIDQYGNVREAWWDANKTQASTVTIDGGVVTGCTMTDSERQLYQDMNCNVYAVVSAVNNQCGAVTMDEEGCMYSEPVTESRTDYLLTNGAKTLFQTLLVDIEKEAQAKYNAKLTKEQAICLNNNNGGILGKDENGSTFMWVKLNTNKVPKNYSINGLNANQFKASNDLYGSFCRARVTLQSDDKDIQDYLNKYSAMGARVNSGGSYAVRYFAVGDSFTCGSWIPDKVLREISEKVGKRAVCEAGYGRWENGECSDKKLSVKENIAYAWGTVAPFLAGGGIGLGLTESGLITKAMGKANANNFVNVPNEKWDTAQSECISLAQDAIDSARAINDGYAPTAKGTQDLLDQVAAKCRIVSTKCPESTVLVGHAKNNQESDSVKTANQALLIRKAESFISTCQTAVKPPKDDSIKAARIAVPLSTAAVSAALGAGITASVIKARKQDIRNEAAQQWMDEVGDHIQCYVGPDEVGTYGDVVSIELD